MFCSYCGADNPDDGRFCVGCRRDLTAQRTPRARTSAGHQTPAAPGLVDSLDLGVTQAPPSLAAGDGMAEGETIANRWRVEGLLGRGGMGEVYRVYDPITRRTRALKLIHPALLRSTSARERFREEAALTQDLRHERIVQTLEVADDGETFVYVMEHLDGGSLRDRIVAREREKLAGKRTQLFELDEVLTLADQILEALEYAHGKGVIHRDVKPENVLLTPEGPVKLADFGLAKLVDPARLASMSQAAGTPNYMAPEQFRAKAHVDGRADLYAVGTILWELLTGGDPIGDLEPPSQLRPDLPAGLDAIVRQARSRDAAQRYSDATTFRMALAEIRALRREREAEPSALPDVGDRAGARPPPPSDPTQGRGQGSALRSDVPVRSAGGQRFLAAGIVTVLLALVGGGVWWTGERQRAEQARQHQTQLEEQERQTAIARDAEAEKRRVAEQRLAAEETARAAAERDLQATLARDQEAERQRQAEAAKKVEAEQRQADATKKAEAERRLAEQKSVKVAPTAMVSVPGGPFFMGCNVNVDSECDADEMPGRTVSVGSFSIDKTEVTVAEFTRCVEAGTCSSEGLTVAQWDGNEKPDPSKGCPWGKPDRQGAPMACLSWYQAKAYCEWLGKRLPTAEQWEKAARGTDGRKYPWGNTGYDSAGRVANISDEAVRKKTSKPPIAVGYDDGYAIAAPPGSFPRGASPYGALDMVGNVAEWTSSDTRGHSKAEVRGGSFANVPPDARASDRVAGGFADRYPHVGLRCAR